MIGRLWRRPGAVRGGGIQFIRSDLIEVCFGCVFDVDFHRLIIDFGIRHAKFSGPISG